MKDWKIVLNTSLNLIIYNSFCLLTAILAYSNNQCFKFIININIYLLHICMVYVSVCLCVHVSVCVCRNMYATVCGSAEYNFWESVNSFHLVGHTLPCFYYTVHSRLRGLWISKSPCCLCLPSQCMSTGIIDTHHCIPF